MYDRWTGDRGSLGVPGLPLHVTVLYPFIEPGSIDSGVELQLESIAASHKPFEYTLAAVDRFPGVTYLAPSPPDPFVELTRAIQSRWPTHLPYGGVYEEVVPHVTLTLGDEPAGLLSAVMGSLPITGFAREMILLDRHGDASWRTRSRFVLGG